MTAVRMDLEPQKRGDTVYINLDDVVDRNGSEIVLGNYTIRCVVKLATSTATTDSDALASVTSGSGITVSGNDAVIKIPPSASTSLTDDATVKYEVQMTNASDSTEVRSLLWGYWTYVMDIAKTSP